MRQELWDAVPLCSTTPIGLSLLSGSADSRDNKIPDWRGKSLVTLHKGLDELAVNPGRCGEHGTNGAKVTWTLHWTIHEGFPNA